MYQKIFDLLYRPTFILIPNEILWHMKKVIFYFIIQKLLNENWERWKEIRIDKRERERERERDIDSRILYPIFLHDICLSPLDIGCLLL